MKVLQLSQFKKNSGTIENILKTFDVNYFHCLVCKTNNNRIYIVEMKFQRKLDYHVFEKKAATFAPVNQVTVIITTASNQAQQTHELAM